MLQLPLLWVLHLVYNFAIKLGHLSHHLQKIGLVVLMLFLFYYFYYKGFITSKNLGELTTPLQYVFSWFDFKSAKNINSVITSGYEVTSKNSELGGSFLTGYFGYSVQALELITYISIIYIRQKRSLSIPYAYNSKKWFDYYFLDTPLELIDFDEEFLTKLSKDTFSVIANFQTTKDPLRFFNIEIFYDENEQEAYLNLTKVIFDRFNIRNKDYFNIISNLRIKTTDAEKVITKFHLDKRKPKILQVFVK
jgi:hypothetical protein